MRLRYTTFGYLYIMPGDDLHLTVDAMLKTGYSEEFCLATDFTPTFIAGLMEAGFLVMSCNISEPAALPTAIPEEEPQYILLPKLHITRSALLFENLHVKKSIRRLLPRYELCVDSDFDTIVNRCLEKHGDGWLTPPLLEALKYIRYEYIHNKHEYTHNKHGDLGTGVVQPTSFALYHNGDLVAGEFGVISGRVYTSYSGYYDEKNAGTIQLIKTAEYLRDNEFAFFDLGMPLQYKNDLGAIDVSAEEFVKLYRAGTGKCRR